jgi:hypothetical protein
MPSSASCLIWGISKTIAGIQTQIIPAQIIGNDDHNIGASWELTELTEFLQIAVFSFECQGIYLDGRILGLSPRNGTNKACQQDRGPYPRQW